MPSSDKAYALVPAAGAGARLKADLPKPYVRLAGRPLLYFALRALAAHPRIEQVFVVLAPGDHHYAQHDWSEFGAKLRPLYCGGETRAASVFNGLLAVRDAVAGFDWVLVHDAARPCLARSELDRLFAEVGGDETGGLLALPVADTVKRAGGEARVAATEPRDDLWLAQTPQMFRYRLLVEALARTVGEAVTDEAAAVERLGLKPRLVMGSALNLKVTLPEDLALAELILQNRIIAAEASRAPGRSR